MTSLHTQKAMNKAARMGGMAGDNRAAPLWDLSKRELIEIAMRLGALHNGGPDSVQAGVEAVNYELAGLRRAGIL